MCGSGNLLTREAWNDEKGRRSKPMPCLFETRVRSLPPSCCLCFVNTNLAQVGYAGFDFCHFLYLYEEGICQLKSLAYPYNEDLFFSEQHYEVLRVEELISGSLGCESSCNFHKAFTSIVLESVQVRPLLYFTV